MLNLSKETIYGYLLICNFPGDSVVKNKARRHRFDPWAGKISWRRKWQATLVFLPGKSCGQRNLLGYSPWGHKESDTTTKQQQSYNLPFFLKQWDEFTLSLDKPTSVPVEETLDSRSL